MIKARRAIAGIAAGAVAFLAASSGIGGAATADLPVGVTASADGGVVRLGTSFDDQPLAGAWVDTNTGRACIGFSYQVPQCVELEFSITTPDAGATQTIVTIDKDASDGDVGVYTQIGRQPLVGIRYDIASGRICAGFSYQVPFCLPVPIALS